MFPILIVDDSREDLQLAERTFRHCSIRNPIHLLSSGEDCLAFLRKLYDPQSGVKLSRALVLIDIAMPGMSGLETIAAINETTSIGPQWIVALSGQGDIKQVQKAYALGAKTFVTKPLRTQDIEQLIQSNEQSIGAILTPQGYELNWS